MAEEERKRGRPAILRRRHGPDFNQEWRKGVRTLGDLLAPDFVDLHDSYAQIGRLFYTVLHVSALDPETGMGFLQRLVRGSEPVDLAWYLTPLPREQAMDRLGRGAAMAGAELEKQEESGLEDPMAVRGAADMRALRHLVDSGEEVLWHIGFYILIHGESVTALDKTVRKVLTQLGHGAHARIAYELMWPGLEAFTPTGQDPLNLPLLVDTTTVVKSWPLSSTALRRPSGIFWGFDRDTGSVVIFSPFDRGLLRNGNAVICGPTGSGKSFTVKVAMGRLLQTGVRFAAIDPKPPGEYRWLCEVLGSDVAEYVDLSPAARRGLNPFALPRGASNIEGLEYPVRRKVTTLRAQLAQMVGGLRPEQEGMLETHLFGLYEAVSGLGRDTTEVPSEVRLPRIADLVDRLEGDSEARNLGLALRKYARGGSLGGLYDPDEFLCIADKRMVVFGISTLPEEDRPGASLLISNWVMDTVLSGGSTEPGILVIDEAHTLLSGPGGQVIADLGRVARSMNWGIWYISQLVEDFVGTKEAPKEQGQVIFENCAVRLYMPKSVGNLAALPGSVGLTSDHVAYLRQEAGVGDILADIEGRLVRLKTGPGSFTKTEYMLATSNPQEVARYREALKR